jgi:thiamine pyrophosphokinase
MERALVLADGEPVTKRGLDAAWPGWDHKARIVVAADGGARLADPLALRIDHWVGDGDSLGRDELDELRAAGVPIELVAADKDESDTELAVLAAVTRGATDVTILGGLGGPRLDHALANVALLGHPALQGKTARILADRSRVTLLTGPATLELKGRIGDLVSLLPLGGDADGVTTDGLRFPLRDEQLKAGPARGLSNVRLTQVSRVRVVRGRLLVVETPARLLR